MGQKIKPSLLRERKGLSALLSLLVLFLGGAYWSDKDLFVGDLELTSLKPSRLTEAQDADLGKTLNTLLLSLEERELYRTVDRFLLDVQRANSLERYFDEEWREVLTLLIVGREGEILPIDHWYLGEFEEMGDTRIIPLKIIHAKRVESKESSREFSIGYLIWKRVGESDSLQWKLTGWEIDLREPLASLPEEESLFEAEEDLSLDQISNE